MEVPDGWLPLPTQAFGRHVGPYYAPPDAKKLICGFLADERHGNKRGVTHGGMIATSFDVGLGNACWAAAGERPCATVQLTIQYVGALKLGEFATVRSEIVRATKSLVFARAVMSVDDRLVATGEGVWKILVWRGEAYAPPAIPAPAP